MAFTFSRAIYRHLGGIGLTFLMLTLMACSPAYNWRELRPDGAALLSVFPCKPDEAEREVPIAGTPSTLHMFSCTAADQTYALAWAALAEGADTRTALIAWEQASRKSLKAEAAKNAGDQANGRSAQWTFELAGAEVVQTVRTKGHDHLGAEIEAQVVYFAMGNKVYQAAVYGKKLPEAAVEPFFSGLKLLP